MKTTMDKAGRLIIPKDIRRQAGIHPGTPLDVRWNDGRIEIEPSLVPVRLVREGRFLVAVHQVEGPVLTSQEVDDLREAIALDYEREL